MKIHIKELKLGDIFEHKDRETRQLTTNLVDYVGKTGIGTIEASTGKYRAFPFHGISEINRIVSGASLSITNIDDLKHHYPEYFL